MALKLKILFYWFDKSTKQERMSSYASVNFVIGNTGIEGYETSQPGC